MKKLFLLSSFFVIISSFGYTSEDVSNAHYLADQEVVGKRTDPKLYRLDDKILRQEVIVMALQIKGITNSGPYTCKKYFADATKNDWVCRAVELAADNGIISKSNKYANPGKYVTRAEALAMMMPKNWEEFGVEFSIEGNEWQRATLSKYLGKVLDWDARMKSGIRTEEIPDGIGARVYWRPNSLATRAEVFAFARNIINPSSAQSYPGFTADFGGDVDIWDGMIGYGFGNLANLENTSVRDFYITVQPRKSAIIFGDRLMLDILGKKYWKGNVYYTTMLSGMCYTGRLIFLTDEYIITVSGACNQTIIEVENALRSVSFNLTASSSALQNKDVLMQYYMILSGGTLSQAYDMRSPAGVSLETFTSWYKNTDSVNFREDTLKDLGDNTYEFLVDMTENGKKSTFKVKSKVNLEKFTIDNISSVKQ